MLTCPKADKGASLGHLFARLFVIGLRLREVFGVHIFVAAQQPEGRCVWGMGLRSRSCRNPLKMKNAHLEALGNSQNNPGPHWNLAVQLPLVNSTILEGCEISRGIFRPLCEINSVRNFLVRKTPVRKSPPPPVVQETDFPADSLSCKTTRPVKAIQAMRVCI